MKRLILPLILLFCAQAYAQVDVLPNVTDKSSLTSLNDNLQNIDGRIRGLQDSLNAVYPIDLSLYGTTVDGLLPIVGGGTGQATAQAAIDALTGVASATNEYVLTKDTVTGHSQYKAPVLYSLSVFSGTIIRDLSSGSGDVSYTGIGFTPKAIIFLSSLSSGSYSSQGFSTGASNNFSLSLERVNTQTSYCLYFVDSGITQYQRAKIKSFDADGFTLTWEKSVSGLSGTATIAYLAIL